jgi:hypothetical protein
MTSGGHFPTPRLNPERGRLPAHPVTSCPTTANTRPHSNKTFYYQKKIELPQKLRDTMSTEHRKKENAALFRDVASQLIYLLVINAMAHSDIHGALVCLTGHQKSLDRDT